MTLHCRAQLDTITYEHLRSRRCDLSRLVLNLGAREREGSAFGVPGCMWSPRLGCFAYLPRPADHCGRLVPTEMPVWVFVADIGSWINMLPPPIHLENLITAGFLQEIDALIFCIVS